MSSTHFGSIGMMLSYEHVYCADGGPFYALFIDALFFAAASLAFSSL